MNAPDVQKLLGDRLKKTFSEEYNDLLFRKKMKEALFSDLYSNTNTKPTIPKVTMRDERKIQELQEKFRSLLKC